jgi:hypothetical protein
MNLEYKQEPSLKYLQKLVSNAKREFEILNK